jgi:hypothetical protein
MRTREAAARAALDQNFNTPGMCQLTTRTWLDAPSVGDVDRDGDSDAMDGYKSEPLKYRHDGDRLAPLGTPLSWSGGSDGHGHRALSLGVPKGAQECIVRSTDAGGSGRVATKPLSWFEDEWHLHYIGWTESMSGILIPKAPKPETRVTIARDMLRAARELAKEEGKHRRVHRISAGLEELPWR